MTPRRVAAQPSYNHKPLRSNPDDLWTRANAGEVLPGVLTPLTWSFSEDDFDEAFGAGFKRMGINWLKKGNFAQLFYGRVYFNFGMMAWGMREIGLPVGDFMSNVGGPGVEEGGLYNEKGFQPLKVARRIPGILKQMAHLRRLHDDFAKQIEELETELISVRRLNFKGMSEQEITAFADRLYELLRPRMMLLMDAQAAAFTNLAQVRYLLKRWLGNDALANDLMTGISGVKTAESNIELWKIAVRARSQPRARELIAAASPESLLADLSAAPEAKAVVADLRRYLEDYGHRAADELEARTPRWVEQPAPLMAAFRGYVLAGEELDPVSFEHRQRQRRLAAEREVSQRLRRSLFAKLLPWRSVLFFATLREAQKFLPLRENPKFHLLKLSLYSRYALLEIARRWMASGFLQNEDDIFFLRSEEILELPRLDSAARGRREQELKLTISRRRDEHAAYARIEPPMVLFNDDLDRAVPAPSPIAANGSAGVLTGIPASAGIATGRARVIINPSEGALEAGEILVAPFTDPGWTPFFPLAAAIVMDLGGMLSHGAVVAREYGIPAVVNTRTATSQITTGQLVTVDGLAGTVTIDEETVQ